MKSDHIIGSVIKKVQIKAKVVSDYVVKDAQAVEFFTEERCHITELCNTSDSPDGSLAIARVESGITTQLHSLTGTTEVYIVIDGAGLMEVNGNAFPIASGDQVIIPAGVSQRVTAGEQGDLKFYCMCTPRFAPESYVNLEDQ